MRHLRLAILVALAACGWARADDALIKISLDAGPGYIVSESYAAAHKAHLRASIPGTVKIEGFWTPKEVNVIVAERVFRQRIHDAAKDPTILFPDLAPSTDPAVPTNFETVAQLQNERYELALVSSHFDQYARQYVGIIVEGKKLIFCNYADVPKADPAADYLFIDDVFAADGTVHFLQCRFDVEAKTCINVSMIGSWQRSAK